MFITFANPVKFEGKEYKDVELKLEDLSGFDLKQLINDYSRMKKIVNPVMRSVSVICWDDNFDLFVASRRSEQPIEFFEKLSASEFIQVIGAVQSFFNSSALEAQAI
ncbi:MAG: hypothetical protein ACI4M9_07745 [Succinivibrio sp.]